MVFAGLACVLTLGWAASTYALARRVWRTGSPVHGKAVLVDGKRITVELTHLDGKKARTIVTGECIEGAPLQVLIDSAMPAWAGVLLGGGMVLGKIVKI
jgi:hypothetical protein